MRHSRRFADDSLTVVRDGIGGTIAGVQFGLSIDPAPKDWSLLEYTSFNGPYSRYLPPERMKARLSEFPTALAQADFIYGLKRRDAALPRGETNPELLAWLLAGPISFVGAGDRLTRYAVGDLLIYASLSPSAIKPKDEAEFAQGMVRARVFSSRTGEWIAEVWGRIGQKGQPATSEDVAAVIGRISGR